MIKIIIWHTTIFTEEKLKWVTYTIHFNWNETDSTSNSNTPTPISLQPESSTV